MFGLVEHYWITIFPSIRTYQLNINKPTAASNFLKVRSEKLQEMKIENKCVLVSKCKCEKVFDTLKLKQIKWSH